MEFLQKSKDEGGGGGAQVTCLKYVSKQLMKRLFVMLLELEGGN